MFLSLINELFSLLGDSWLFFSHITGQSSFPQALTAEEEEEKIKQLTEGSTDARRELIEHNLRLVAHIAKKYTNTGIEQDDLVSIGAIGLIKAVKSYRPESGRLATFASRCIENEILMAIRSNRKTKGDISLNAPIGADREGNEITLCDILGTDDDAVPDQVALRLESRRAIKAILHILDQRERTVILMRYGLKDGEIHAQNEIADLLGISRSYVSRIEKKALAKLKRELDTSGR